MFIIYLHIVCYVYLHLLFLSLRSNYRNVWTHVFYRIVRLGVWIVMEFILFDDSNYILLEIYILLPNEDQISFSHWNFYLPRRSIHKTMVLHLFWEGIDLLFVFLPIFHRYFFTLSLESLSLAFRNLSLHLVFQIERLGKQQHCRPYFSNSNPTRYWEVD